MIDEWLCHRGLKFIERDIANLEVAFACAKATGDKATEEEAGYLLITLDAELEAAITGVMPKWYGGYDPSWFDPFMKFYEELDDFYERHCG